ncbi:MAG: HAD-IIIA family hydrolase [Phycisphaerales bacterium]|nr:HAD-IIIA family hydrolase [Phycisphaerales bacterium]
MRAAVFLDRDETLNRADSLPPPPPPANPGDVTSPALVELLPGVADACARLRRAGFLLVVCSNQGSVARGAIDLRTVEAVNDRIRSLLPADLLDAFYVCPFHTRGHVKALTAEHPWRKPGPGMIEAAAAELSIDTAGSWAVGDKQRDRDSAIAAGIDPSRALWIGPDRPIVDLAAAADVILKASSAGAVQGTTVRLRATSGAPLAEARNRATVIAAAGAIAERTGIGLLSIHADDESVTVTLDTDRIAAIGFLAELRRSTNAWYAGRISGGTLWGEDPAPE